MTKLMVVLSRVIRVGRSGRLPRAHPKEALTRTIGWRGAARALSAKNKIVAHVQRCPVSLCSSVASKCVLFLSLPLSLVIPCHGG